MLAFERFSFLPGPITDSCALLEYFGEVAFLHSFASDSLLYLGLNTPSLMANSFSLRVERSRHIHPTGFS